MPMKNNINRLKMIKQAARIVTNVDELNKHISGVTYEIQPNGTITNLEIALPYELKYKTRKQTYQVSNKWIASVNLAIPFAEAIGAVSCRTAYRSTARNNYSLLNNFFKFLFSSNNSCITLDGINDGLVSDYVSWLNASSYTQRVKGNSYTALKTVIALLSEKNKKLSTINFGHKFYGETKNETDTDALSIVDYKQLISCCIIEMKQITAQIRLGQRLISEVQGKLSEGMKLDYKDHAHCLYKLSTLSDGVLPSFYTIDTYDRELSLAIKKRHGGYGHFEPYLYASGRHLVPFIIGITAISGFNTETVLSLKTHPFRDAKFLADSYNFDRDILTGTKNRSNREQVRTFLKNETDLFSPRQMVSLVNEITKRTRMSCPQEELDYLFIFPVGVRSGRNKTSIFRDADAPFNKHLRAFRTKHKLPEFTLGTLRKTMAAITMTLTGGDLKATQYFLNHKQIDVTDTYYVPTEAKRRRLERLAEFMNSHERLVRSGGKSDAQHTSPLSSNRAATDGFECFDPYQSPIEGQENGRLCYAWGECPACPMASVNIHDHYALAHICCLKNEIERARYNIDERRWITKWAPVLLALKDVWIPLFPKELFDKAKFVKIISFPEIE